MLVSCKGEKGIPPIHQIAGDEGIRIHNGRQGVGGRAGDETDDKEDLQNRCAHSDPGTRAPRGAGSVTADR